MEQLQASLFRFQGKQFQVSEWFHTHEIGGKKEERVKVAPSLCKWPQNRIFFFMLIHHLPCVITLMDREIIFSLVI